MKFALQCVGATIASAAVVVVLLFAVGAAAILSIGYAYENTWSTPEGFYPMTLTADEAGRCHEDPDLYDSDGSLLSPGSEMCDRITVFRDGSGTIRAIAKVETSSVTDNTYYSDWKVVGSLAGCEPGDHCMLRNSEEMHFQLDQQKLLAISAMRGEGTDF